MNVEIKKTHLVVGKKKILLISGEIHYWRLDPSSWKPCLRKIKEMGLSVIATYVPWDYHEYQRGLFDFTGKTHPKRNLEAFLELAKKEKLWVIIRPGPYIYSEWKNDGVPDYVYKYHRLHPRFLVYAKTYLTKVSTIIRPFLASKRGGNIILLQADNEIDPWTDVFGGQYGIFGKAGFFQKFIKGKYDDDIASLNQAWGTSYERFQDVGPYEICEINDTQCLRRNIDFYEFKHFYSRQVAEWAYATFRNLGIDVPVYFNAYPFFYAHDWKQFSEVGDLVGIDLYPVNEYRTEYDDHRKMMDKVRYMATFSDLPYIAEFASGVWHNHHYSTGVITPRHYRLLCVSMILAGVKGWNWYMLVNRDNWYMSPINEWGTERWELYSTFKDIIRVFNRMHVPACKKVTEVALTFNPMHYATQAIRLNEETAISLYNADVDYTFFDPADPRTNSKILFYSGADWLSRQDQEALVQYVKNGGIFIAFRQYPRKDENFDQFSALNLQDPDRILFKFKRHVTIQLERDTSFSTISTIGMYNVVQGKPIYGRIDGVGKYIVGYRRSYGRGTIIHIFLEPNNEMIYKILSHFSIQVPVLSHTEKVKTSYFVRGKRSYVAVANNSTESNSAVIELRDKRLRRKKLKVTELFSGNVETYDPHTVPKITCNVEQKSGCLLEIAVLS